MSDNTARQDYCKASLALSDQNDVGEAGAIAALDSLYVNNNIEQKLNPTTEAGVPW